MIAVVAAAALVAVGVILAVALNQPAPLTIRTVRIPTEYLDSHHHVRRRVVVDDDAQA